MEHKMTLNVGAGVHIGKLMLGTIGEHERMDGTVIADAVNRQQGRRADKVL